MARKRRATSHLANPSKRTDTPRPDNAIIISDSEDDIIARSTRRTTYNNPIAEAIKNQLTRAPTPSSTTGSQSMPQNTNHAGSDTSDDDGPAASQPDNGEQDDFEDAKLALAGPKRRGRKVGSGKGERRKAKAEYSTNANTMKSRKRFEGMNQYEQGIERAKQTASSWVSKHLTKWKRGAEYKAIPHAEVAQRTKDKRRELQQQRENDFNDSSPGAVIKSIITKFKDRIIQEDAILNQADVIKLQRAHVHQDDDRYWEDIEFDEGDAEYGDEVDVIVPAVDAPEQVTGDKTGRHFQTRPIDQITWNTYRTVIRQTMISVEEKQLKLKRIGPILFPEPVRQVPRHVPPPFNRINSKWLKLSRGGHALPTPGVYFTRKEAKMIQASWAVAGDTWVTLPGPSEWWPDVTGNNSLEDIEADNWYKRNGFDLPPFSRRQYAKAYKFLMSKRLSPPKNWTEHLLHKTGDLVWV